MKWFKHDSNARHDAKLTKLRIKYGMEGYGLYFFLLECIAGNVEPHNLSFELEEDSEVIAVVTNIHQERVEEMMLFMVDQGLFEESDGMVTCLKMATKTDEYTQKLIRTNRNVRTLSGDTPEKIPPNRIEQKRIEKKKIKRFTPPTVQEVSDYCSSRGNAVNPDHFLDHYEANGWMRGKNKIKDWKACVRTWEKNNPAPSHSAEAIF